jgi:Insertion element 4 transposase N-terminal
MPRVGQQKNSAAASSRVRLTDRISLGVLADVIPRDFIEDVLAETGRREKRSRLLPAHVMVRFCLAMSFFFDDDYEEVMRKLVGSLQDMASWSGSWPPGSKQRTFNVLGYLRRSQALPSLGRPGTEDLSRTPLSSANGVKRWFFAENYGEAL